MARPRKEGMDYFPHDVDASNDKKIEALRSLYGNDGYVFYFIMLEEIYKEKEFQLDVSDAETREEMFQILASKIQISAEKFKKMLDTAFRWEAFNKKWYEEEGIITSNGIKKRAAVVVSKRAQMREKYHKEKQKVSDAETGEESTQSKSKSKSKVKEYKRSIVEKVVPHLNKKIGTHYKTTTKKTTKKISARIDEGFKLEDFIAVVDKKVAEWKGTEYEKYLRPETLFGTKFESYLNQKIENTNDKNFKRKEILK